MTLTNKEPMPDDRLAEIKLMRTSLLDANARKAITESCDEIDRLRAALAARPDDVPAAVAVVRQNIYEVKELGLPVLGDEQCCELACDGGACESCPCCWAGWCVFGHGAMPEREEDWAAWLEVAAEHNPVAARLLDARPEPIGYVGVQRDGRVDHQGFVYASPRYVASGQQVCALVPIEVNNDAS